MDRVSAVGFHFVKAGHRPARQTANHRGLPQAERNHRDAGQGRRPERPQTQKVAPSIIATLSRLTGHADPQQILDLAPGELQNLPGFAGGNGAKSQLGGYPAYQYGGSYAAPGGKRLVAQKTVVIRTGNGLYVLQIDADGIDGQQGVLEDATRFIDQNSTITP
jgi:hypothetical protein